MLFNATSLEIMNHKTFIFHRCRAWLYPSSSFLVHPFIWIAAVKIVLRTDGLCFDVENCFVYIHLYWKMVSHGGTYPGCHIHGAQHDRYCHLWNVFWILKGYKNLERLNNLNKISHKEEAVHLMEVFLHCLAVSRKEIQERYDLMWFQHKCKVFLVTRMKWFPE